MDTTTSQSRFIRETFPVGPLGCNCTILGDRVTGEAVLIDPGGDPDGILARINQYGLKLKKVIHTHAHLDHFLASGEIKKRTGAPLALHRDDFPLWQALEFQCNMFQIPYQPVPDPDSWLTDDEDLGFSQGVALHTPGHSPGSMSFFFQEAKLLIAGDTLFRGSIGRTDLWGGDPQAITASIKDRLYRLDDDVCVVTGHGDDTTIGHEKAHNPFVKGR